MQEMKKVRIGAVGGARGKDLFQYCIGSDRAELVAVCDFNEEVLENLRTFFGEKHADVILLKDFDDLLKLDLDGIVLANYANEHAPFAIKCLDRGINVMSEVLPACTLKEAAELVDAVERSGKIYYYAENYCFLDAAREMKRLCEKGLLGNIEYAEGEYFHNCEPIWHSITYGQREHWRNHKHAFYYCTHSLGPIIHATKLRPVSVTGFEPPYNGKMYRCGAYSAPFAMEIVTLENGAIARSCHGQTTKGSVWYSLYGSLGHVEAARETEKSAGDAAHGTVYASLDLKEGESCDEVDRYIPQSKYKGIAEVGHQLADRYIIGEFISALRGEECDVIDVYEAMDMFLPGIFAYKSVLAGGIPQAIPNFRNKEERDLWRNDVSSTYREISGEYTLPAYSKGEVEIDQSVYDGLYKKWRESQQNK